MNLAIVVLYTLAGPMEATTTDCSPNKDGWSTLLNSYLTVGFSPHAPVVVVLGTGHYIESSKLAERWHAATNRYVIARERVCTSKDLRPHNSGCASTSRWVGDNAQFPEGASTPDAQRWSIIPALIQSRAIMGTSQASSVDVLFQTIYYELKHAAHGVRTSYNEHALHTTQLVHELYLRLRNRATADTDDRFPSKAHFFAYAARAMRSIVIDHARGRTSSTAREQQHFELNELLADQEFTPILALQIDQSLRELQKHDERAAKVVELHFFLGLSLEEIAEQFELSARTIDRDWQFARAFLHTQLAHQAKT